MAATGAGITESLSKFEVAFLAAEPPRVVAIGEDAAAAAEWSLLHLQPAEGFVGALAMHRREARLKCWAATN